MAGVRQLAEVPSPPETWLPSLPRLASREASEAEQSAEAVIYGLGRGDGPVETLPILVSGMRLARLAPLAARMGQDLRSVMAERRCRRQGCGVGDFPRGPLRPRLSPHPLCFWLGPFPAR